MLLKSVLVSCLEIHVILTWTTFAHGNQHDICSNSEIRYTIVHRDSVLRGILSGMRLVTRGPKKDLEEINTPDVPWSE